MADQMKVSIAMATYNGEWYLREQLQSFLRQTRQPDELIITDDCSTDETETIVRDFAQAAPFKVEFYRNEKNLGFCGNFNAAMTRATGDLVFLSDQDDVWFPEKIEHMVGVAEKNSEALVVMNDAALTDGELNELGPTMAGQLCSSRLSMQYFLMGCCCAIRRELLDFCLPIPAGYKAHDSWIASFADGLEAKVIDREVLQYYRRHESNASQTIANRATKLTRKQVLVHSIKKTFSAKVIERKQEEIEQLWLFIKGIQKALTISPEKYQLPLRELLVKTEIDAETQIQRLEIRKKWLLSRIIAVLRLSRKGGYRNTSGVRAILRDIVG